MSGKRLELIDRLQQVTSHQTSPRVIVNEADDPAPIIIPPATKGYFLHELLMILRNKSESLVASGYCQEPMAPGIADGFDHHMA